MELNFGGRTSHRVVITGDGSNSRPEWCKWVLIGMEVGSG